MQHETIIAGDGKIHVLHEAGDTTDIINTIREADKLGAGYITSEFALQMAGEDVLETCANIYKFVHDSIPFIEDKDGVQDVQSPGQLYKNRRKDLGGTGKGGDCKSFSLFCSSVLKSLGINDFSYRFISENPNEDFHHVYLIVNTADGYIPLDCTLDEFCTEVFYKKKLDLPPAKNSRIGATKTIPKSSRFSAPIGSFKIGSCAAVGLTEAEVDFATWEDFESAYSGHGFNALQENVKQQCISDIDATSFSTKSKNEAKGIIQNSWGELCKFGTCMLLKFWDKTQAAIPDSSNVYFGYNMYVKQDQAAQYYNSLRAMGIKDLTINNLARLACFNVYGCTGDYMLYKCYCMVNYGQPFKPIANVPYFDSRTGEFHTNGGDPNTAYLISLCFPIGGGLGRPFGSPYWCVAGYIMGNGASETDVTTFAILHPRPNSGIVNNNAGVSEQIMSEAQTTYNHWRLGETVVLPVPYGGSSSPAVHGCLPPRIGYSEVLIAAIIAACVAIVTLIGGLVVHFTKPKPPQLGNLMIPPKDFLREFRTVDGCYIGVITQGQGAGHQAKMCGTQIVEIDPDLNDPANTPGANSGTGGGNAPGTGFRPSKEMIIGGVLLTGAAILLFGGSGNNDKN